MKAKKLIALLLSVLMLVSVLGTTAFAEGETADTESAEAEEALQVQDALTALNNIYNYYPGDTEILTVNGTPVTWDMFAYWLDNAVYSLYNVYIAYLQGLPTDLSDGDETAKQDAVDKITYFLLAHEYAEENSVALTDEQQETLDGAMDALAQQLGDEDAVDEALAQSFLTRDVYTTILHYSCDMSNMMEREYGADGELMSEEDVVAWGEENGFIRVKHILWNFPTKDTVETDDDGNPVDAEAAAAAEEAYNKGVEEVRAEVDGFLAELKELEGDDAALEARFDEIMNAESEDGGLAGHPDGYTFASGTMVAAFEDAAFALENYHVSDVVETGYGYHVLLRLPVIAEGLTNDQNSSTGEYMSLRQNAAASLFSQDMLTAIDASDVQWLVELPDLNTMAAGNGSSNLIAPAGGTNNKVVALIIILGICAVTAVVFAVLNKKKGTEETVTAAEEAPAEKVEETAAEAVETETPAEEAVEEKKEEQDTAE